MTAERKHVSMRLWPQGFAVWICPRVLPWVRAPWLGLGHTIPSAFTLPMCYGNDLSSDSAWSHRCQPATSPSEGRATLPCPEPKPRMSPSRCQSAISLAAPSVGNTFFQLPRVLAHPASNTALQLHVWPKWGNL